jgi:HD-GYP domain-containing protein (c-di-GMP phosphodiesterase class II)
VRKSVAVAELQFGMYIAELDRPWTDTPFIFQGFVLQSAEQLEILKKYCRSVYVDTEREERLEPPAARPPGASGASQLDLTRIGRARYVEQASVEHEVGRARLAYAATEASVLEALRSVHAGRTLDSERIGEAVSSMTGSVLRNPDALLLFSQLEEKNDYTTFHALDVAVYMTAFGRFLQLPAEDLTLLAYVGLLQDIGKVRVPNEILTQRERLSAEQFEQAKEHVRHSVEILGATSSLPREVAPLAALHHERQDGSGYPKGLRGREIGLLGSIAAIVDVYAALTAHRPYADAVAPSAALSMLYKWRGAFLDPVLVEQFIRCIGIYPLGSIVELNSREVGIVITQNLERRLQPRVMVIHDPQGQPLKPQKLLDLARGLKTRSGEPYRIQRTLEYGRVAVSAESLFA